MPYARGDIVLGPAPAADEFTWPELLAKFATLILIVATGAVVYPRILTFQPMADGRQISAGIALVIAALLFDFGLGQILDWRRKRRAEMSDDEVKRVVFNHYGSEERALAVFDSIVSRPVVEPVTNLQRHLADALGVMLRHPELTIDAGTLRLLARKPPKVRGKDGRWQKGRA